MASVLRVLLLFPAACLSQLATATYNDHYYVLYSALQWGGSSRGAAATFAANLPQQCGKTGHLVDITSAGEQAAVESILAVTGVETWIGLTRGAPSFVWSDTSTISYNNWAPSTEPNNSAGYDCVYIDLSGFW